MVQPLPLTVHSRPDWQGSELHYYPQHQGELGVQSRLSVQAFGSIGAAGHFPVVAQKLKGAVESTQHS